MNLQWLEYFMICNMTVKELKQILQKLDDDIEVKYAINLSDGKIIEQAFYIEPLDRINDSYLLLM